jgi:hypothetical protein
MHEPVHLPRRAQRLPAAHVEGKVAFHPLRLVDLSDIGARMETDVWLAVGREYVLRLDDPPFQIPGRVVWARLLTLDGGRPVFEAGLEFAECSPAARQQLTRLMAALAVRAGADAATGGAAAGSRPA